MARLQYLFNILRHCEYDQTEIDFAFEYNKNRAKLFGRSIIQANFLGYISFKFCNPLKIKRLI